MKQQTRVRIEAGIMAGIYLAAGLLFFRIVPKFEEIFSEVLGFSVLPTETRLVLGVGPFGWLLLFAVGGAAAWLVMTRCRSRLPFMAFAVLLLVTCGFIVIALFLPMVGSPIIRIDQQEQQTGAEPPNGP